MSAISVDYLEIGGGSWTAVGQHPQDLQFFFLTATDIHRIEIQGAGDREEWVKELYILYSLQHYKTGQKMWQYCLTPDEKNVLVSKKTKQKKKTYFSTLKIVAFIHPLL